MSCSIAELLETLARPPPRHTSASAMRHSHGTETRHAECPKLHGLHDFLGPEAGLERGSLDFFGHEAAGGAHGCLLLQRGQQRL